MGQRFDQFVQFGTDPVGLERFLRLVQSVCQILSAAPPSLLLVLLPILPISPEIIHDGTPVTSTALAFASVATALVQIGNRIGLVRRAMRLFRFLRYFRDAHVATVWLDVVSHSLLGIYGLLQSATLPDALDMFGVGAWGPVRAAALNAEAQRCRFVALACGVLANGGRMLRGRKDAKEKGKEKEESWRLFSDALDMLLPASALGWTRMEPWTVGVVMLVTSLITGREAWERCGREVRARG